MSKITLVNNGAESQSIQNHMAGRLEVPAGATVEIDLNPAKDITTQAFLKKFYNQYKEVLDITYDIADYPLDLDFEDIAVTGAAQTFVMFGTPVSDLQENDVAVADNAVTGTLKYLASGQLVDRWGAGNFLAIQFAWDDSRITDVKVGLNPSATGMELQSIFDDPDRNGAWKITDKGTQKFIIETYAGDKVNVQTLDLSGLTCLSTVTSGAKKNAGTAGIDTTKVTAKVAETTEVKDDAKAAKKSK